MFLKSLIKRNPGLIESAVTLHQNGAIPANSYVIDVDRVLYNSSLLVQEAQKYGLKIFAMTKQIGRNPIALRAIKNGGIDACVAVDMACARPAYHAGLKIGHIGHLVQVPHHETQAALRMQPEYWTVFSIEKAQSISDCIKNTSPSRTQNILLRIHADGDTFYRGHEGGFSVDENQIVPAVETIDALPGLNVKGITTFPAQLFDEEKMDVYATHNLRTLEKTAEILKKTGMKHIEINAPGTTSSYLFQRLASVGVTQVEPGHGLTGTVPLNAYRDLDEIPAIVYATEVSHIHENAPYCFGGGMYIDPVFKDYVVMACVGSNYAQALKQIVPCEIPSPESIDYYGILDNSSKFQIQERNTVVFGFRAQAFVTRAYIVPVSGITKQNPMVEGVYSPAGRKTPWPMW